ncbi:MAG: nucleotidyltransferase family protein [Planctomycetota bacterium]
MTKESILEVLGRLQPEVRERFQAELKGFFGSCARGEQSRGSDVDVLVEFGPEADLFDFVGLADFLEEELRCAVDLVPIGSLREEIKGEVLREAVYL